MALRSILIHQVLVHEGYRPDRLPVGLTMLVSGPPLIGVVLQTTFIAAVILEETQSPVDVQDTAVVEARVGANWVMSTILHNFFMMHITNIRNLGARDPGSHQDPSGLRVISSLQTVGPNLSNPVKPRCRIYYKGHLRTGSHIHRTRRTPVHYTAPASPGSQDSA